jgi:hypothetical protein
VEETKQQSLICYSLWATFKQKIAQKNFSLWAVAFERFGGFKLSKIWRLISSQACLCCCWATF